MLVVEGRPIELDAHMARLIASVDALFGSQEPASTRKALLDRARGIRLGRMRLTVVPQGDEKTWVRAHGQRDRTRHRLPSLGARRRSAQRRRRGGARPAQVGRPLDLGKCRSSACRGNSAPPRRRRQRAGGFARQRLRHSRRDANYTPADWAHPSGDRPRADDRDRRRARHRATRAERVARRPHRRGRGVPDRIGARHRAGPVCRWKGARAAWRYRLWPRRRAAPPLAGVGGLVNFPQACALLLAAPPPGRSASERSSHRSALMWPVSKALRWLLSVPRSASSLN